jgi:hypothetical protein
MKKAYLKVKNYTKGGLLFWQKGYRRKNGKFVRPHFKTKPDGNPLNNRKYLLGY